MASAYKVVDSRTDRAVADFDSSASAYADADRRDAAFGAVRFAVRRDYEVMSADEFASFMEACASERVAA